MMEPDGETPGPSESSGHIRSYPEEDLTPTTTAEIYGFYSYSIAAEVFAVVGVGAFLPVTLEQLARENGVLFSDRSTPCVQPASASSSNSAIGAGVRAGAHAAARLVLRAAEGGSGRDPDQCVVRVFGGDVTTASFAMYTFSIAVLCQALCLVSFSGFADYGSNRKKLLLGFGIVGALTSISFIFVVPKLYLLAPLLVIIGVTCLGSSFVVLNSFLPVLAAKHPDVQAEHSPMKNTDDAGARNTELRISDVISSKAVAVGYLAAVFVQVLAIAVLLLASKIVPAESSKTVPLRMILVLAGVWWLVFMVPTYKYLRARPGPRLQTHTITASRRPLVRMTAYVRHAWVSLYRTIRVALRLKQMARFLLAWFLLSDAVASISGTAVLFARTELGIGTVGIALLSITAIGSGIFGAALWPFLSARYNWSSSRTIITCISLMEIIPLYGLLPYIPFISSWGVLGLQQKWEIYPLAIVHGIVMGGISSYCRSFFGQLVPPGHEAAFFALFAITDKGSSAIGPAVVGRIVDTTGHIRPAFWFLVVLVVAPIPLVWGTDVEAGRRDARVMAGVMGKEGSYGGSFELGGVDWREAEAEREGLMRERDD